MTYEEYLGDWVKVVNKSLLIKALIESLSFDRCPETSNILKAFTLCSLRDIKAVFLGQDPYPQKGVATGVLFGNKKDVNKLSPSLEVVKNTIMHLEDNYKDSNFDVTLESWAKQGILMINSALTVEEGKPGSHAMIWRPFIADLLVNLGDAYTGIVYVLFGGQAQTFIPYINTKFNHLIVVQHPSYFARIHQDMPAYPFEETNKILYGNCGETIKWMKDE